jgi:ABC-type bacteriocin/lantibiotic exporter with double-glycine peptidase domain
MSDSLKNPLGFHWKDGENHLGLESLKKFFEVLPRKKRQFFFFLVGMMLVAALFELLSIGLILPVIGLITNYEQLTNNIYLNEILIFFGNPDADSVVILSVISLTLAFVVKNIYLAIFVYVKEKFILNVREEHTLSLYEIYMSKNYSFHTSTNSAEIIRNVTTLPMEFERLISIFISLLTEFILVFSIAVLFLYVEPVATIIMALVLLVLSVIFYYFFKDKTYSWGVQRHFYQGNQIKTITESLGAIKDIKTLEKENFFISQIKHIISALAKVSLYEKVLSAMPRLWLEVCIIFGFLALVTSLVFFSSNELLLPTLALFGFAAIRLIPSVTTILSGTQVLRMRLAPLSILAHELKENLDDNISAYDDSPEFVFEDSIILEDINFGYSSEDEDIFINLDLEIKKGEFIGIMGSSGSGKSTLLDLILGFYTPKSGKIIVDNKEIDPNATKIYKNAGLVSQHIFLLDKSIKENIALNAPSSIDEEALKRSIDQSELSHFIELLPEGLDTEVGERGALISGGQLQRIGIARALYDDPQILVFDEATNALDNETEKLVLNTIASFKGNKTVIFISHSESALSQCDRIIEIKDGKIFNRI